MECEKDLKKPLNYYGRNDVLSQMRCDFFRRLPDKVKGGVDLEDLVDNVDLSTVKGLLQGSTLLLIQFFLFLFRSRFRYHYN